jgi:hypothetical protein
MIRAKVAPVALTREKARGSPSRKVRGSKIPVRSGRSTRDRLSSEDHAPTSPMTNNVTPTAARPARKRARRATGLAIVRRKASPCNFARRYLFKVTEVPNEAIGSLEPTGRARTNRDRPPHLEGNGESRDREQRREQDEKERGDDAVQGVLEAETPAPGMAVREANEGPREALGRDPVGDDLEPGRPGAYRLALPLHGPGGLAKPLSTVHASPTGRLQRSDRLFGTSVSLNRYRRAKLGRFSPRCEARSSTSPSVSRPLTLSIERAVPPPVRRPEV